MNRRFLTKLVVCSALAAVASGPVFAFLGIGDIVFDPSNYAQALERLAELKSQYSQLVQTYEMIQRQYEQMVWMAKRVPVDMSARYRALAGAWHLSSAADTYGRAADWLSALNSGGSAASGYAEATEPLLAYGGALANVPADQADHLKTNYTTVELADGANVLAMETIGDLRARALQLQTAIAQLENDSLSSDPGMNTEIAVLNKINAANLISVRSAQDTNKLLVSLTEQEIIDAKRKRDAEARAINQHIRFVTEEQSVLRAQAGHASEAMLAWRMP